MKCLITGVAGFIGSHLCDVLLNKGYDIIGIDCFTDYYPREIKVKNLQNAISHPSFKLIEKNILDIDLTVILENVDYIFHHAAQAGVRASWGQNFSIYTQNNIMATQYLLEACKEMKIKRFIYASSSSVYGNTKELPMREDSLLYPLSPYGVSKLAAEHLCNLYWTNYGIPVVSLRYFTVFGPRQRPDMAFYKFIKAIKDGVKLNIYGDGNQTRDFTYISDIIDANISAMESDCNGEVMNIGGGARVSLLAVLDMIEEIMGDKVKRDYLPFYKGDMMHTYASIDKASKVLNYTPKIKIYQGLKEEILWILEK